MKMKLKITVRACPLCGGVERCSAARSRRWRPLVFVRSYSCLNCHSQYIVLFGLFSRLIERGFKSFHIPASETDSAIHSE